MCQICSRSVHSSSASTPTTVPPAALPTTISHRRSNRSAIAPANGEMNTPGSEEAMKMMANWVADPVLW